MKQWIKAFRDLVFPRCCLICGDALLEQEEYICTRCNVDLPRTHYHLCRDNHVEKIFWEKIPLEQAAAYLFYKKGGSTSELLYSLKYYGYKELGEVLGRHMATEMAPSGFFQGIDLIIPIPLHQKKLKKRGYNQSEWLALGISHATGIPIETESFIRKLPSETQTRKTVHDRWENVQGIFSLIKPERLNGKHVLLIDDMLTTGATLITASRTILDTAHVKMSILTLAVAVLE